MITIAIIGAGTMAKTIATRANELNIRTLCFAWKKGAVAADFVDTFFDIDIFDTERIIDICRKEKISGVIATTELTIKIAAIIANELELNTNPLEVAANITNKGWVREKGKNFKFIKQPEYFYITEINDLPEISNFPVIVKPVSLGGKKGITVVYSKNELQEALEYAITTIGNRNKDGIVIEEFLNYGQEYSVETLSFNGKHNVIQITQKDSSGAPHCVELGHHQPALLSENMRINVERAIEDMLTCIGLKNGPSHTEIKIINDDIYLIEINARPGGDFITYPLTELSTGYKILTGIILTACGIFYDPKLYKGESKYAGVYFITKLNPQMKKIFDSCDGKDWLYKKNKVSEELQDISHNDSYNINSIIYCSNRKITMEDF